MTEPLRPTFDEVAKAISLVMSEWEQNRDLFDAIAIVLRHVQRDEEEDLLPERFELTDEERNARDMFKRGVIRGLRVAGEALLREDDAKAILQQITRKDPDA